MTETLRSLISSVVLAVRIIKVNGVAVGMSVR
jgi:hypothetical protein